MFILPEHIPGQRRVIIEPLLSLEADFVRRALYKYWPAMDIADGCLLQLAERFPRAKIVTTDLRDFRIYRRSGGQPLNLIHP